MLLIRLRSQLGRLSWATALLPFIVVFFSTAFPRLMLIGGPPASDEGCYGFYSQLINMQIASGGGLPAEGRLMIYPMLVSWVFSLSFFNHFILLRLVDLFIASVSSWLLYRVLVHECESRLGGALISFVFIYTMNAPLFIQCGFKNSIFAAYIPLFLALRLAQSTANSTHKLWGFVGALVALTLLLRETFIPFLIVGALAILVAYGWRSCLRFIVGVVLTGLIITVLIAVARGSFYSIINSYLNDGHNFSAIADKRIQSFVSNGILSAREAMVALIFAGVGLIMVIAGLVQKNSSVTVGRFAFWLSVAIVPLIEPAAKIGFQYHFAVCLPGLAGLTALGYKLAGTGRDSTAKLRVVFIAMLIGAMFLLPKAMSLANQRTITRSFLQSVKNGSWPREVIAKSNYLLAAEAISKVASPNGTLCVSRFMFPLYILTGMFPPNNELVSLNAVLYKLDFDEARFKRALLASPPDVLMTSTATDWPGEEIVTKVVISTGLYEPVATIPEIPSNSYGFLGGTIYRRINPVRK